MISRLRSIGLLTLVLAACSNAGAESDDQAAESSAPLDLRVFGDDELPEEQRRYFQDDKVSLSEYEEAYSQFAQCAADAGVGGDLREQGRDEVTGLITYSTQTLLSPPGQTAPGQSGGAELNSCYHRFFFYVERAFQATDPAVLAAIPQDQMMIFNDLFRPCLERIGIVVPDDLEYNDENWAELNDQAVEAFQDGRCGPDAGGD